MVELERDRQDPSRERASERDGCEKVRRHLEKHFVGGKALKFDRVRDYFKECKALISASPEGDEAKLAKALLVSARMKRGLWGWETSTWALVLDASELEKLGFAVQPVEK